MSKNVQERDLSGKVIDICLSDIESGSVDLSVAEVRVLPDEDKRPVIVYIDNDSKMEVNNHPVINPFRLVDWWVNLDHGFMPRIKVSMKEENVVTSLIISK